MGHKGLLRLGCDVFCVLLVALVLYWHLASCASVTHKQPIQPENAGSPPEKTRLYAPAALPKSRRDAALQLFEKVHPTLTIHYSGFSRQGSLVCYDMLNELRTVDEARALMDLEFHLLDLMLEHYKVAKHMRVVDASVAKRILDIGNLFSVRFPTTIRNITQFIKAYEPILRVFLSRYLPHIESLVIINVPSFLVPFVPTIAAHIMGIPSRKIVALSSGAELGRFIESKYIPKEFGNPKGLSVKSNDEDITAHCLMLEEIKRHLGENAISEEGKNMLGRHGERLLGRRVLSSSGPGGSGEKLSASQSGGQPPAGTVSVESKEEGDSEKFDDID